MDFNVDHCFDFDFKKENRFRNYIVLSTKAGR